MTRLGYVPGAITGALCYLPLALLAARFAAVRQDVDAPRLLLAFTVGTLASFAPFLHGRALLFLRWLVLPTGRSGSAHPTAELRQDRMQRAAPVRT